MEVISQNAVYFAVVAVIMILLFAWAYFTKRIQKDFITMTWVLIPVAIAINLTIGQIVLVLKLPVYLDSIGTVLVGVICGPWAGALTGALSNIIAGIILDPGWFPWFPVAAAIGATAGVMANIGYFKNWWKVVVTGFVIAIVATVVGTPISIAIFGGISASGSSIITAFLLETGRSLVGAVLTTNFIAEPLDKIATSLLAFAIIDGLSARYLSRFPRGENAAVEKGQKQTQMIIALVVVVLLILFGIFILPSLTAG
ncbi:MAG TPA: ECF transporter S component [Anaerolineales bacterium]|nr:ECF transporter S component [Anaerolineae bacterium]HRJ55474.1 ECF transporter S component [Anaerolineales bacterium]HRK90628.1 ECF transporter S component [Anaerolineales bacterium]